MTVGELIERLKGYREGARVWIEAPEDGEPVAPAEDVKLSIVNGKEAIVIHD